LNARVTFVHRNDLQIGYVPLPPQQRRVAMLQSVFDARKRNRTLIESILLEAISIDRGSHSRAKRLARVLV